MAVVVLTFDFIFSVMMSLLTEAGVQEIFVGTATYCAVLVTFLGNLQNSRSGDYGFTCMFLVVFACEGLYERISWEGVPGFDLRSTMFY